MQSKSDGPRPTNGSRPAAPVSVPHAPASPAAGAPPAGGPLPGTPTGASPLLERQTLEYHEFPRPGKTEVVSTKPVATQHDLSLAYTPGVAVPCLKIQAQPDLAYRYTN